MSASDAFQPSAQFIQEGFEAAVGFATRPGAARAGQQWNRRAGGGLPPGKEGRERGEEKRSGELDREGGPWENGVVGRVRMPGR